MGRVHMVMFNKYHMKTRGRYYDKVMADAMGIRRIYNHTSSLDFMDSDELRVWANNLYDRSKGESVLIESAIRDVGGGSIFVMTCIVFYSVEQCNLYYIKNRDSFRLLEGFLHLLN